MGTKRFRIGLFPEIPDSVDEAFLFGLPAFTDSADACGFMDGYKIFIGLENRNLRELSGLRFGVSCPGSRCAAI